MSDPLQLDDGAVLEAIRRSVATVVPEIPPSWVTPERTLAELGCNSIDRADIVTMAMEELGVTVPVSELGQGQSVGVLVALLQRYA